MLEKLHMCYVSFPNGTLWLYFDIKTRKFVNTESFQPEFLSIEGTQSIIMKLLITDVETDVFRIELVTLLGFYEGYLTLSHEMLNADLYNPIYYCEFVLKSSNKEKNHYYIETSKNNIPLSEIRSKFNGEILSRPNWEAYFETEEEYNLFSESYNLAHEYYNKSMHNATYRLFYNYSGLSNLLITMLSILIYLDKSFEDFSNIDSFSDTLLNNLFRSFGLDAFLDLPKEYRKRLAKNINQFFINKGSIQCFKDIMNVFREEFQGVSLERYYILRTIDVERLNKEYYSDTKIVELFKDNVIDASILKVFQDKNTNPLVELGYTDRFISFVRNKIMGIDNFFVLYTLYNILQSSNVDPTSNDIGAKHVRELVSDLIFNRNYISAPIRRMDLVTIKQKMLENEISQEGIEQSFLTTALLEMFLQSVNLIDTDYTLMIDKYEQERTLINNESFKFPYNTLMAHLKNVSKQHFVNLISNKTNSEILILADSLKLNLGVSTDIAVQLDGAALRSLFLRKISSLIGLNAVNDSITSPALDSNQVGNI